MERRFNIILAELRKENGLSQKAAATQLGVSQALLSHYEKGIRECGMDFLMRAADFYGVSCDYLLGRTPSRTGGSPAGESHSGDNELSAATVIHACESLGIAAPGCEIYGALELYAYILRLIDAGVLPESWNVTGAQPGRRDLLLLELAREIPPRASSSTRAVEAPECIKTIMTEAETFVKNSARIIAGAN